MTDVTQQKESLIKFGYDEAIKDVKTILSRLHSEAKQNNKLSEMKYFNKIVKKIELL